MPTYTVHDPQTGKTLKVTGDSPPTEAELTEIFSQTGATNNTQPADQGPPDPWADLRARGEAILSQDERPHTEPTPGMDGFVKGLSGNSDIHFSGDQSAGHILGDVFSAENAGDVVRNVGMMGAGTLIPGGLKAGGAGLEAAGRAAGSGPGALAMRSMAGSTVGHMIGGGPVGAGAGAAAAATLPPMLRGFGRVMQRTGEAMSGGPEPPPRVLPQVSDLGNVPEYTDLGNPNAPSPRPPPAQLGPAPSGPFQSPPSSAAPRGMMGSASASAPPSIPPPSLAAAQQAAMLEAVQGPAPLGSLPASQSPRVLSWKPGFGPSAGDAATLREAYGSKTAGSLLKARGDQIKTLAPTTGPSQLPAQVSDSLGQSFLAASPEARQQMLTTASPLVRQLFQSLAERTP